MSGSKTGLGTGLKQRHVTMMSIAGVIGAGLFVGSGHAIAEAGPASILAYAIGKVLLGATTEIVGGRRIFLFALFGAVLASLGLGFAGKPFGSDRPEGSTPKWGFVRIPLWIGVVPPLAYAILRPRRARAGGFPIEPPPQETSKTS